MHFLTALAYSPDSASARRDYERARRQFKYATPERWQAWPYSPRVEAKVDDSYSRSAKKKLDPPGPMAAPMALLESHDHLVIGWRPCPMRDEDDKVAGYELEAAEVCRIDGLLPMASVCRGPAMKHKVSRLLPETPVHVRVRAFNGAGNGPWSEVVVLKTLEEPEPPPLVPYPGVPGSWEEVDIADLLKEYTKHGASTELLMISLMRVLKEHSPSIKIAFRFYCMAGASNSTEEDPNSMGMTQFLNFARNSAIVDKKLAISACDLVYKRAVRVLPGGASAAIAAAASEGGYAGAPGAAEPAAGAAKKLGLGAAINATKAVNKLKGKPRKANQLAQHQFVGALVRLAIAKYAREPLPPAEGVEGALATPVPPSGMQPLEACIERLMTCNISPHVERDLDLLCDSFSPTMATMLMKAVLHRHEGRLKAVFDYYAGVDASLAARQGYKQSTMNIKETADLCEDLSLFDGKFGVREMVAAFVRVNIDDELYVVEEGNDPSELVFDEFCEVVARIFNGREVMTRPKAEREGLEVERAFNEWLGASFLPAAEASIKARMRRKK